MQVKMAKNQFTTALHMLSLSDLTPKMEKFVVCQPKQFGQQKRPIFVYFVCNDIVLGRLRQKRPMSTRDRVRTISHSITSGKRNNLKPLSTFFSTTVQYIMQASKINDKSRTPQTHKKQSSRRFISKKNNKNAGSNKRVIPPTVAKSPKLFLLTIPPK
jgi:hypothetical protein